jgi:hypothetical protein
MKMVVTTELWKTKNGVSVKAVVRDTKGRFLGMTNMTRTVPTIELVGRK